MAAKRRGLGSRDLDVLLGPVDGDDENAPSPGEELRSLSVERIAPGKYQPRRIFDEELLNELAASIKAQGLIQPIIVRPLAGDRYELIAGERRWRAARLAGLARIPAIVRAAGDPAAAAMTLIENIQRADLSALEEAKALRRLIDDFGHTHQQLADAIGRSRAAVSNLLRLLDLPEEIQRLLREGRLDAGHAKALATLAPALALGLARRAVEHGWSVRELEAAARETGAPKDKAKKKAAARDADIAAIERELSEKLAAPVRIDHGRGGRGKLVIGYHSLDELDGILERLRR